MFFYRRSIGQLYHSDTDSDTVRTQNDHFRQATKMVTKNRRTIQRRSFVDYAGDDCTCKSHTLFCLDWHFNYSTIYLSIRATKLQYEHQT